ncbi:[F-actin]-monooxygenase MICAL3 [Halotydeus destructor]|nr:[F-actin]-monooxygenase MICAL3 [Halotydeus destructor]
MARSPPSTLPDLFDQFVAATTLKSVVTSFRKMCHLLDITAGPFHEFYPSFKKGIIGSKPSKSNWKAQSIFSKIDKKASNRVYQAGNVSSRTASTSSAHHTYAGQSSQLGNNVLSDHNCLVVGGGPCGLRSAIELQLLGSRHVVIIEKRDRFSRNNVLHLWPFVIADLKLLAGKKFYGKFCAGSIDHVSIRQLQLMLLKFALILGCEFVENIAFGGICQHSISTTRENNNVKPTSERGSPSTPKRKCSFEPSLACSEEIDEAEILPDLANEISEENKAGDHCIDHTTKEEDIRTRSPCGSCWHNHLKDCWSHPDSYVGAYAHFSIASENPATSSPYIDYRTKLDKLLSYKFDIVLGADGRRNTLNDNFPRKEFRGKLAIAITANFINTHSLTEAQVPEISGISFIYNQHLFKSLYDDTGIDLENICYYKDDTHYFVMTAKKNSLLKRGVLYKDYSDTRVLLSPENINRQQLLNYAKEAAKWTTGLENQNFALNHYGEADVAMFDFTSMYAADNACRAKKIVNLSTKCDECKLKRSTVSGLCTFEEPADEGLLLVSLVGDSLLEPFWPTGSGCARGFLSAYDAGWMCRQWATKKCSIRNEEAVLDVLTERECIYRLLAQTTPDNLSQNFAAYTISPISRYPNLNTTMLLPHQNKHLLHDGDTIVQVRPVPKSRTSISAKRLRRATIATTSPFTNAISENVAEEAESHVISVTEKVAAQSQISQDLEDSFAAFEENYKGLICGDKDRPATQGSAVDADAMSAVPNRLHGFTDLSNSPSISNMLSLGRSRAKEIEGALRHRRQQQMAFQRGGSLSAANRDKNSRPASFTQTSNIKHKVAWLLEHGGEMDSATSESLDHDNGNQQNSKGFVNRVKDLEAKFAAASGVYSEANMLLQEKKISTKGSLVMSTANNLEQLLNPKFQEDKLKREVDDYKKKTKDIKCVLKLTSETDWNRKRWDDFEKEAAAAQVTPATRDPAPRPQRLIDVFESKKKEIVDKLEKSSSGNIPPLRTERPKNKYLTREERNKRGGDWILMLKNELDVRSTSPTQPKGSPVKPAPRSPFIEKKKEVQRCPRCLERVLLVDQLKVAGQLYHRECLICSKCGDTMRWSDIRQFSESHENLNCSLLCRHCTPVIENRPTDSTPVGTANKNAVSLDGVQESESTASVSGVTENGKEYENRIRERIRWKEQFLLNNNNIDFGRLVSQVTSSIDNDGNVRNDVKVETEKASSKDVVDSKISERMEYENTSVSFELYDEDELTKMLNLESDQWESGEDETTSDSESWQQSDSTDNDFDSDEFDLSEHNKEIERRSRKRAPEKVVVPQIMTTEKVEEFCPTSEEVDANVFDISNCTTGPLVSALPEHIPEKKEPVEESSSESDSETLAEEVVVDFVIPAEDLTPTGEMERRVESKEKGDIEFADEETDDSISSLSCCDAGTFDDLNLVSMIDEEVTSTLPSASRSRLQGLTGAKPMELSPAKVASSREMSQALARSSSGTSFKVAQPGFTVFNLDQYTLPPLAKSQSSVVPPTSMADEGSESTYGIKGGLTAPALVLDTKKSPSPASQSGGETYSKIPVLASRMAAESNVGRSANYPSYSGGFTEKLLQRCCSTPAMLSKSSSLGKWSFKVNLAQVDKAPYGLTTSQLIKQKTAPNLISAAKSNTANQLPVEKSIPLAKSALTVHSAFRAPSSSPLAADNARKSAQPLSGRTNKYSTVSPPAPFYERLAKELVKSRNHSVDDALLAPKATLDDDFTDDEESAKDMQANPRGGKERLPVTVDQSSSKLHIIESKLRKDRTVQDEQLLRQWFSIKNTQD